MIISFHSVQNSCVALCSLQEKLQGHPWSHRVPRAIRAWLPLLLPGSLPILSCPWRPMHTQGPVPCWASWSPSLIHILLSIPCFGCNCTHVWNTLRGTTSTCGHGLASSGLPPPCAFSSSAGTDVLCCMLPFIYLFSRAFAQLYPISPLSVQCIPDP